MKKEKIPKEKLIPKGYVVDSPYVSRNIEYISKGRGRTSQFGVTLVCCYENWLEHEKERLRR